ncbi:beta strand repeat-containing protein, partial [Colwellia psychrerythraea]
ITGNTAQDITLGTDIARIETLNAQVGTNTLRGENATNDWNITAANTGTIDDQTTTLSFTNFINLIGGTAVDTFTLSDVALVTGLIDGGAGSDKVDITGSTAQDIILGTDITRIETLTAQIGTNTLRADNTTNDWNITAANTGTIYDQTTTLSFTNFINLVGGTGVDNFTLADITHVTGLIDGGAGSDKIDITGNTAQDITLGTDIARIETLNAQVGTNTLRGENATNDWNITAANTGTIDDQSTTLSFTNFSELVGGTLVDDFLFDSTGSVNSLAAGTGEDVISVDNITQVATTIDGGANDDILNLNTDNQIITLASVTSIETINATAGTNTLQGGNATNTWTINSENAGTLNTTTFSNFNNLTGGTGVDNFTLADIAHVTGLIDGGAGSDKIDITGNTAQDITLG